MASNEKNNTIKPLLEFNDILEKNTKTSNKATNGDIVKKTTYAQNINVIFLKSNS